MAQTYEFTLDRAQKTRDAQDEIKAKWLWSEKNLAQWDADNAADSNQAGMKEVNHLDAIMLNKHTRHLEKLRAWKSPGTGAREAAVSTR